MADKFRQLDDEFEQLLDTVLLEVRDSDLTPLKREDRLARVRDNELEFNRTYFPLIFNSPWNELHKHIATLQQGKYSVSGFRKSGKSAATYIGKIVRGIATRKWPLINLSLRTLDKAKKRTSAIMRLVQRNRILCYDYNIKIEQDAEGWYLVNGVLFIASSYMTGLRSIISDDFKRIGLSVNDDLYDLTTVKSKSDNQAVYEFIVGEIYGAMEDDGLSITLGNRIDEDCPIEKLVQQNQTTHFSFPALNDEGESNWPERFTRDYWAAKEADTPVDIWDGDYMDRPPRKGDIFDDKWNNYVNINVMQIIATICAIDPSSGTSPSACMKAAATLSLTDKGKSILQDMYLRKEDYESFFDYLDAVRWQMKAFKCFLFENDFNQWALAKPYYHAWMKRTLKTLPIVQHLTKDLQTKERGYDKDSRILSLVYPLQNGLLLFNQDLEGNRDFKTFLAQLRAYGSATKQKLDGLDALATAYIMLPRYVEQGSFKALKQRTFSRNRLINKLGFSE